MILTTVALAVLTVATGAQAQDARQAERDRALCIVYGDVHGACGGTPSASSGMARGATTSSRQAPTVSVGGETYFRFSLLRLEGDPRGFLTAYEILGQYGPQGYYRAYGDSRRFCLTDGIRLRPEEGINLSARGRVYGRGRGYSWGAGASYDGRRAMRDRQLNDERSRYGVTRNFCQDFEREHRAFETWNGGSN